MRAKYGKWSKPGVPHHGWNFIDLIDLGEPLQVCEMCEHAEVRYVHLMEHVNYSETLKVGCVCAERMENDYVNPRMRENKFKSTAKRKSNWKKRKWKISRKGNFYTEVDGLVIVIFPRNLNGQEGWSLSVKNKNTEKQQFGQILYLSVEEAKIAAFTALIWTKNRHALDWISRFHCVRSKIRTFILTKFKSRRSGFLDRFRVCSSKQFGALAGTVENQFSPFYG